MAFVTLWKVKNILNYSRGIQEVFITRLPSSREVWQYRNRVLGPMESSNASLTQKWALSKALGSLCGQSNLTRFPDGSYMAQFTTTALVARDILEIIDQVELNRLRHASASESRDNPQQPLHDNQPALLNYCGNSYGSYLGNTFASMFPPRIGRMIMDSVVESEDYTATGWFSNLQDYHKSVKVFFQDCFDAGPLCALNTYGFATPEDMANKVNELLGMLKTDQIILHGEAPNIVTFADVSLQLLSRMCFPTWSWIELADILVDLLQGNGTSMGSYLPNLSNSKQNCNDEETGRQLLEGKNRTQPYAPFCPIRFDASVTTLCSDGDDITHLTYRWLGMGRAQHAMCPLARNLETR